MSGLSETRRVVIGLLLAALLGAAIPFCLAQQSAGVEPLLKQAYDLHAKGKFPEALVVLRRAYTAYPHDYFVNLLLGIDSLRAGHTAAAIPFLKEASRLRPKEEIPLDYLGEAYARQEMFGDAAEAYIRPLQINTESAESRIAFVDFALTRFGSMTASLRSSNKGLAAEYRLQAMALAEADPNRISLLRRAADLDASAPGIWSDLAHSDLEAKDLSASEVDLNRALQSDPNDLEAHIMEARIAAQNNDWPEVSESLNFVAQHSPETLSLERGRWPRELLPPSSSLALPPVLAAFFSCVRDVDTACALAALATSKSPAEMYREQNWKQILELPKPAPSQAERWLQRGVAFVQLDDCPQGIPALERGVTKSTSSVYGMFLLSWCYSQEAGRTAANLKRSGDDDAALHTMRGDLLLRLQSKPELAISEYQAALARNPSDPSVLERLAEAQFGAGKNDDAKQTAQAAIKIDPRRPSPKRTLAKIAMQQRDYANALPYLKSLVVADPRDVPMRVELAKACAQTGAVDEAWKNLSSALDGGYPDENGSLHYLLGTVLKKMGRTTQSDQAFAVASQLSDTFQQKSYHDQEKDASQ
jgi:tetratricopeptide (TPR) repeat protein